MRGASGAVLRAVRNRAKVLAVRAPGAAGVAIALARRGLATAAATSARRPGQHRVQLHAGVVAELRTAGSAARARSVLDAWAAAELLDEKERRAANDAITSVIVSLSHEHRERGARRGAPAPSWSAQDAAWAVVDWAQSRRQKQWSEADVPIDPTWIRPLAELAARRRDSAAAERIALGAARGGYWVTPAAVSGLLLACGGSDPNPALADTILQRAVAFAPPGGASAGHRRRRHGQEAVGSTHWRLLAEAQAAAGTPEVVEATITRAAAAGTPLTALEGAALRCQALRSALAAGRASPETAVEEARAAVGEAEAFLQAARDVGAGPAEPRGDVPDPLLPVYTALTSVCAAAGDTDEALRAVRGAVAAGCGVEAWALNLAVKCAAGSGRAREAEAMLRAAVWLWRRDALEAADVASGVAEPGAGGGEAAQPGAEPPRGPAGLAGAVAKAEAPVPAARPARPARPVLPGHHAITAAIDAFGSAGDVGGVRRLDALSDALGMGHRAGVRLAVVRGLCRCGPAAEAEDALRRMASVGGVVVPVVARNWVVSAHVRAGRPDEAMRLVRDLHSGGGFTPDAVTMASIVTAGRRRGAGAPAGGAGGGRAPDALEVWRELEGMGGRANGVAFNALAAALGAAGRPEDVRAVMGEMAAAGFEAGERAWVALVHSYARGGSGRRAEAALDEALASPAGAGLRASEVLWGAAAGGFAAAGRADEVERVLRRAREEGGARLDGGSADAVLVKAHVVAGDVDAAAGVLEVAAAEGREVSGLAWSTLCSALAARGLGPEAVSATLRAADAGVPLHGSTLVTVVRAFGPDWEGAEAAWGALTAAGAAPSLQAFNALARTHGAAGHVEGARAVRQRAAEAGFAPDSFTFRAVAHAAAVAGLPREAEAAVAEAAAALGSVTLADAAVVVNAYAQAGDLEGALAALGRGEALFAEAGAGAEAMGATPRATEAGATAAAAAAGARRGRVARAGDGTRTTLYNAAVKAAARAGDAEAAVAVVQRMSGAGVAVTGTTVGVLVDAFVSAGDPAGAEAALARLAEEGVEAAASPGVVALTSLADGWATEGVPARAEAALARLGDGEAADAVAFAALTRAYATVLDLEGVTGALDRCEAAGLDPPDAAIMSAVAAFCRAGEEPGAAEVVDRAAGRERAPGPKLMSYLAQLCDADGRTGELRASVDRLASA